MARLGRSLPMPVSACTNHNVTMLVASGVAMQSYMITRDLAVIPMQDYFKLAY